MSHIYTFDTGIRDLQIQTRKKIPDTTIQGIRELIILLSTEININLVDSSAKRFNQAEKGFPIIVNSFFVQYLEKLINIQERSNNSINFFSAYEKNCIALDHTNHMVVKKIPLALTNATYNIVFIVDLIDKYLADNKISNYLIRSHELIVTSFEKITEINPYDQVFIKLKNSAVKICDDSLMLSTSEQLPFGAKEDELKISKAIIIGKNPYDIQALTDNLPKFKYHSSFQKFAKLNDVSIIIIEENGLVLNL